MLLLLEILEYSIRCVVSYCVYTPNTTFAVMVISNCWMRTFLKKCEGSTSVGTYSIEMWNNYTCQPVLFLVWKLRISVYIFQIRIRSYNSFTLQFSVIIVFTSIHWYATTKYYNEETRYSIWTPDKSIFKYSVVCVGWANNILQTRSRQQIGFTILSESQCYLAIL